MCHFSMQLSTSSAQDMQQSGAPLRKICQAGPWRSGAIFKYLDECELEADVALEAAMHDESDGEELAP